MAHPPMRNFPSGNGGLEHRPESMPSDLIRGWVPVFPRDKREAFARRSCSNKKTERDDDSKKSHPALGRIASTAVFGAVSRQ
jgi:hypothetical protein